MELFSTSTLCPNYFKKDRKKVKKKVINYNGRKFVSIENTDNGEVSSKTIFIYQTRGRYHLGNISWWRNCKKGHWLD